MLSNMDREDVKKIQENAKKLMIEKFPKSKFISDWKNLIEKVLK